MTNSLTDSRANMTIPGRTTLGETAPGGERSRSPQMVVLGLAVLLVSCENSLGEAREGVRPPHGPPNLI